MVESGEPPKPEDERPSTTWLILERLDDISAQVSDLRTEVSDVRVQVSDLRGEGVELRAVTDARFESVDRRFDRLERRWTWSLGIVAMMILGLLTKLLLPGG
ncbi:MAG: hypothetical protein M0Z54_10320 [Thermaerobacter sp.]|nr:hypothetical protein [Thermaerobacter sp.]